MKNVTLNEFNYKSALYRRNNFGQPCVWAINAIDDNSIVLYHGIIGKTITKEIVIADRKVEDEIKSRIAAKRKVGYKFLEELTDNVDLPVEGSLQTYLEHYLPTHRDTADGNLLPMLAKIYDNTNNRVFRKVCSYFGQWKINGLRCFISAYANSGDMFKPIGLKFQSREGTCWNSLSNLEEYLLTVIKEELLNKMVEEHYILDGEIYLPGHSVNEINHFVKDPTCAENKLLQYWCYDIAIDEVTQLSRLETLYTYQAKYMKFIGTVDEHLNNAERLVVLPVYTIINDKVAVEKRNEFINMGFEGLIMRNPDALYQYGKRNFSMIKFKATTDGKFTIVDIYPEGITRSDIPLLLCKNDINDECFECHLSMPLNFQREILKNKDNYIGKQVFITYGERSGVTNVPFHIKKVILL